ncbi:ferritin-like domain-containing protein [Sphingomonas morindae]|uniref:Ferritin-like domain-containing protein n=1 Tax=Sphingomonas morindae TaxID=1541170 RepID=A0ABY4X959_9SPHN|nr:ferritin-like domain-containing protein [Sphingomonas morindae]USI73433.1 ferritin-like domain-containing protein [Sphingomonas morindae]
MDQHHIIAEVLERQARRRDERRKFLKAAGMASATVAASSLLAACGNDGGSSGTPNTTTAPQISDADILNFALNLEYLEANFYAFAVTGAGIGASLQGGTGTQGAATGGRAVAFTDPVVKAYAAEIAGDELAHVAFLRSALGSAAVAQPAIDVGTDPNGAFSSAARAAGLISAGQSFDPYASDENFLLGAFIFEDVGVTAYKGASPLITNSTYLEAAAGILAAEAYHAGLVRTALYAKGLQANALITAAGKISDARDSLDGASDDDQGLVDANGNGNIVPTDANGIAYSRTTGQVLDIVYLTSMAKAKGGFFPNGVNGTINMSTAG